MNAAPPGSPPRSVATPDLAFLLRHPAHFYALGFGAGLARKAPGTFGTLVALPIAFVLWQWTSPVAFVAVTVALGLAGVWAAGITGRDLGVPDHGAIVCDEVVAYLAVLAFTGPNPLEAALGFALFRYFDIVKPPPIRQLDARLESGFGVMLDDLLAAGYTIAVLAVVRGLRG